MHAISIAVALGDFVKVSAALRAHEWVLLRANLDRYKFRAAPGIPQRFDDVLENGDAGAPAAVDHVDHP